MSEKSTKGTIAVVGTGFVGRSWAMLFAGAGYNVNLYDENPQQVLSALQEIRKQLLFLEDNKILRGQSTAEEQFQLIKGAESLKNCVKGAFYVQECVFERVDVKRSVFLKLDALADDKVILASSVSCIAPADFTEDMVHRSQVVVAHPVNPPYYAPMVEMVSSPWTNPAFFQKTRELMIEIGQKPMTVKKHIYGFVSNRIQYSILNECWRLIRDDVVSVEDMETVMSEGLGMRYAFMGPFETAYLNADGWLDYCERYAQGCFNVSETFGPVEFFSGETAEKIQTELEKRIPGDAMADRRRWRDNCLIALSKLKKQQGQ